ncbi:hypothetical protein [Methanococcus vannielii]|uniref:hypothetical protein n=1 Tax=Methanococcus vannielii TaxID=2187 RepID=UPI00064ED8AE|nr:hypothetical protein [Methanococcus vannielii]
MKINPFKSFLISFLFFLSAMLFELLLNEPKNSFYSTYMILRNLGILFLLIGIILQLKLQKMKK